MYRTRPGVEKRRRRRLVMAIGVVCAFALVVIVGQVTVNADRPHADAPAPHATAPSADAGSSPGRSTDSPVARREADDPMALGDLDAPVVLTEWTDLRCPFCAAFNRETLPTIVEDYVDKGLVRIEMIDVSYFGEQSVRADVAARAAAAQGRYFPYLDTVYAAAPEHGHPDMPRHKLIGFAKTAGIPDIARFTADLDDPSLRSQARRSTLEAQRMGVTGVPFFVAGDTALSGAQPVSVFRQFLDQAVEKAKK